MAFANFSPPPCFNVIKSGRFLEFLFFGMSWPRASRGCPGCGSPSIADQYISVNKDYMDCLPCEHIGAVFYRVDYVDIFIGKNYYRFPILLYNHVDKRYTDQCSNCGKGKYKMPRLRISCQCLSCGFEYDFFLPSR